MIDVKIKKLDERAIIPEYKTELAAGMDLYAVLDHTITLRPLERTLVKTGLSVALPASYEAQIRPRSGLALKQGITVVNTPGTIDADYRGEIGVILINLSDTPVEIHPMDRIAQMVIAKHETADFIEVDQLSDTERGSGGFGSTGVN